MFPCTHCGKVLASAPALRNHIYIHTGEKPWSCNLCPATFRLYSTLYDHKKVSHVDKGKFKCTECPCRFAASLGLRRHVGIYHTKTNLDAISMNSHNPLKPSKGRVTVTVVTEDGTRTYPCHYCGKVFYKSQYLRNHYPVHTGERKSICNLCGVGFKSSSNLLSHKKVSHVEGGSHKCEKCSCVFASLLGLVRHRRLLHNIGKAGLILQTLKRVKLRKVPARLPVNNYYDNDDEDDQDDGNEDGGEDDFDNVDDDGEEETFECKECGKILASAFGLRNHMYIHTGDKPWQCQLCGISFRLNSTLHGHKKTSHVPNGKFKCDECPCQFVAKFGLRRHKICFHDIQQPLQFSKLKKRKVHDNISLPSNETECQYCGLFFKNSDLMQRHLLTHNEDEASRDRPFPCSQCECTYISRRSLRKHEKTAHVEGGKKCPKCPCSFLTNQARKSHHTKMHVKSDFSPRIYRDQSSVESPQEYEDDSSRFPCPTCGKYFNSKPNLRQHMRTHSGRRYECELCHETFSLQSNMIRHKRTCHVEGGPFKCNQCTHCYSTTKGFKRHCAQAHGKRLGRRSGNYAEMKDFIEENYDDLNVDVTYHRPSAFSPQRSMSRQPSKIKFNFQKPSVQRKYVEQKLSSSSRTIPVVKKPLSKLMIKLIALIGGDSPNDSPIDSPGPTTATTQSTSPSLPVPYDASGPPVCQVCFKRFTNHHTLRGHMSVHTGERPFDCDLCGQHFRQKGDIVSHKKTNHAKDGKFRCAICPCRFISIQGFKRHMAVIHNKHSQHNVASPTKPTAFKAEPVAKPEPQHSKVTLKFANTKKTTVPQTRAFVCDLCGAAFNFSQNLTRHRKVSHVDGGVYKCPNCTCAFVSPTSLRTHEAIFHQLEKKSVSARKFTKNSESLFPRAQPRKVSEETSGDFYNSSELSRAPKIVMNGNKKSFLCQLCGASFRTYSNCANHINVSHVDGGQYACGQCPCIFSAFKGLKRHEGIYHNIHSKNLKSQSFSIKSPSFEIYNDNDFGEEDDDDAYGDERGRHGLEIYNDFGEDEQDLDGRPTGQFEDDEDYDDAWDDEPDNSHAAYPTKSSNKELSRGHKQIIFDKDLEDEEELMDMPENDPLDTSKKYDQFDDENEFSDDNFRNDPLRMVIPKLEKDTDPLTFQDSSEPQASDSSTNFRETAQLKQASSSAHVFGPKGGPGVNGFQKRINRFIPANHSNANRTEDSKDAAYTCTECNLSFSQPGGLRSHMRMHAE